MRRKKICFQAFICLIIVTAAFKIFQRINTNSKHFIYLQQEKENTNANNDFEETAFAESVKSRNYEGKIVTILTTFVPHVLNKEQTEMDKYRTLSQTNFLQTTSFTNFKAKIQYIIFTNCSYWKRIVQENYQNVMIQPLILRIRFSTPLLKDMMAAAMENANTPFYMFANSDNLYDTSLLRTINRVLGAIKAGELRTKILVIGHRFNLVVKEIIKNENEIEKLMELAIKSKPFAKDFAIMTKDSFDWSVFPDLVVGRQFFDSYLVDYAFHNEIQVLDATDTIRLVHQEFKRGYSTAMNADKHDNEWNKNMFGDKTSHSSIHCANYKTKYKQNKIEIFDREKSIFLQNKNEKSFVEEYTRELGKIQRCEKYVNTNKTKAATLTIIIQTNNKPDSFSRLLQNINKSVYNNKHIDLIININKGLTGFYDLETLKISSEFEWTHGHKCSHLTNEKDELSQIIEITNSIKETPFLLLQDDVILSIHFHTALTEVLEAYEVSKEWHNGGISGISLEPPLTEPYDLKSYHKIVARYSETMVLSRPIISRAFYPNKVVWRLFIEWVKGVKSGATKFRTGDLADSFAASKLSNGNVTEWYIGMLGIWFCHFVEVSSGTMGYLMNPKGAIGMWGYRTLDGNDKYLSYTCDTKNAYVKTKIPILSVENPIFRFKQSPSRIEI